MKTVPQKCAIGAPLLAILVGHLVASPSPAPESRGVAAALTPSIHRLNPPPKPFGEGPRKVIVGTTIFAVYEGKRPYANLERRLDEVGERLDEMSADAHKKHGRGLDIAVFPESCLNARVGEQYRSVPLEGAVRDRLGAAARKHRTYLVVNFNLLEKSEPQEVYNASVLFDRDGKVAGIYRKVFPVPLPDGSGLFAGKLPGNEFPTFDTDFGRIGMLICYDVGFDDGFEEFARAEVDLILWSTMSPQTFLPRAYARRYGMYIVSSTPRTNAGIFDPLGEITAQITAEGVLTRQIDLDYRIVHWQPKLNDGQALRERYGDRIGYHFVHAEDTGIFWSNDPKLPIGRMLDAAGFHTDDHNRNLARTTRLKVLRQRASLAPVGNPGAGIPSGHSTASPGSR